jgi:hypothetical protein
MYSIAPTPTESPAPKGKLNLLKKLSPIKLGGKSTPAAGTGRPTPSD